MASPAAGAPKKFNWLLVILPLVILSLVGIGVAWETFRAKMEAMQQGQGGESRLGVSGGQVGRGERKSREVKVGTAPVAAAPVTEDDEVTGLGKKKKPPPPKPAAALSPVDRAWRSLKSDYDKL